MIVYIDGMEFLFYFFAAIGFVFCIIVFALWFPELFFWLKGCWAEAKEKYKRNAAKPT